MFEGRGRGTRLRGQGGDGGPRTFAGVDEAEGIEGVIWVLGVGGDIGKLVVSCTFSFANIGSCCYSC